MPQIDEITDSNAGHERTPENTPLPGGGRWRWDDAAGAWVSLDEPPEQPNTDIEKE